MERPVIEILGFHLVSNIKDKNHLTTEKGPCGIIVLCTATDSFSIDHEGGGYRVIVHAEVG